MFASDPVVIESEPSFVMIDALFMLLGLPDICRAPDTLMTVDGLIVEILATPSTVEEITRSLPEDNVKAEVLLDIVAPPPVPSNVTNSFAVIIVVVPLP